MTTVTVAPQSTAGTTERWGADTKDATAHITMTSPRTTSGTVAMFGGTKDGKAAYVDYTDFTSNMNPVKDIDIVAEDMRTMHNPPSFGKNGFEFRTAPTALTPEQLRNSKTDPEAKRLIEETYYDEVKRILAEATGGKEITPFGFNIRAQDMTSMANKDTASARLNFGSLSVAHVDRDPETAPLRLAFIVGEERAQELMSKYKRWASVNIWRPIETVQKWPLLLVNHENIPDWDYDTHMDRVYAVNDPSDKSRGGKGHDTLLRHHPDYTYQYASELRPEEILIFSSFDTDRTKIAPHGAFWDNSSPPDAPTRRSIEVRSFVFWDEV